MISLRKEGVKSLRNHKENCKRIPAYLIGLLCTCFGVALVLKTNLGLDAWNGVFAGLERITPFSFGTWSVVIQGAFLLIAAALNRKMEWLSVFPIIYKGIFLDAAKAMVSPNFMHPGVAARVSLFLCGYLLVALGTGLYVATGYPKMPIDGLMIALSNSYLGSIKKSRLLIEITGFISLLLVGGTFGIGTIIITFTIGHFISAAKRLAEKWVKLGEEYKESAS